MPRPFQSELVLTEHVGGADLKAFHVGFDQNKFRLQPLVDLIIRVIPEFAFGLQTFPMTEWVDKLREAAKSVYSTDKYAGRGEFGELILHLLLRDFCCSVPLISKIYFKDSDNSIVHGFDGVHVTDDQNGRRLWLGESKFYGSGHAGILSLVDDLRLHLESDYLRREFALISKKLPLAAPEIEHWRNLIHPHQRLDVVFKSIVIPMVCTYTSDLFSRHIDETEGYLAEFSEEVSKLGSEFSSRRIATSCEVLLMLLPVPSKKDLCDSLNDRLAAMRNI